MSRTLNYSYRNTTRSLRDNKTEPRHYRRSPSTVLMDDQRCDGLLRMCVDKCPYTSIHAKPVAEKTVVKFVKNGLCFSFFGEEKTNFPWRLQISAIFKPCGLGRFLNSETSYLHRYEYNINPNKNEYEKEKLSIL